MNSSGMRRKKKSKISANLIHFYQFQMSLFTAAQQLQTYTLNESVNISLKFLQKWLIHSQDMSSKFLSCNIKETLITQH